MGSHVRGGTWQRQSRRENMQAAGDQGPGGPRSMGKEIQFGEMRNSGDGWW